MESSSSSSSKAGKAPLNNNIRAHCLADGCTADLRLCRDYHRRHKVCEIHSKTPKVTIGGQHQRFCQQCSRFHSLGEFDEGKRSCRKRLDGHNRRRRKGPGGLGSSSSLSSYQEPPMNYYSFPQHMTYNINPLLHFHFQMNNNNESAALSLLSHNNNYFQSDPMFQGSSSTPLTFMWDHHH